MKLEKNNSDSYFLNLSGGHQKNCSKINQGTIWAQNGHTKNLAKNYVPKIKKVVKPNSL